MNCVSLFGLGEESGSRNTTRFHNYENTKKHKAFKMTTLNEMEPVLVFGASGAQGRAVLDGLLDKNFYFKQMDRRGSQSDAPNFGPIYGPIYGVSRNTDNASRLMEEHKREEHIFGHVRFIDCNLNSCESIKKILLETKATNIFFVTTTHIQEDMKDSEKQEFQSIKNFFDALILAHDEDNLVRHVVFSAADDVLKEMGEEKVIQLKDGSTVANFMGKARGAKYGLEKMEGREGLTLTVISLPFLHSNFLGSCAPLPNSTKTEWTIEAPLGHDPIDMMSVSDLAIIVPNIFEQKLCYDQAFVKLSAEKIKMSEAAAYFADLFGKDIIYNPLTPEEMTRLNVPAAGCMAQMGQYLSNPRSAHDIALTEKIMFPIKPQKFKDWLLIHSDNKVLEEVGLMVDATPITKVCVFGSTGLEGTSVVKGLLDDHRKTYTIRAVVPDPNDESATKLKALAPDRIEILKADLNDVESVKAAIGDAGGVFLLADFYKFYATGAGNNDNDDVEAEEDLEEVHVKNVIDACELLNKSVKHVVFCTMEDINEMSKELDLGLPETSDKFDAKARTAAYAREKNVSITYFLVPLYSERFFDMIEESREDENTKNQEQQVGLSVPVKGDVPLTVIGVEDLGKCVANVFDSYQSFAGHEIGLVGDFVTVNEVVEYVTEVFYRSEDSSGAVTDLGKKIVRKDVTVDEWVEQRGTHTKDLGTIFGYLSNTEAVKKRRSLAKTLKLCPDTKPFKQWLEHEKDNVSFREKLGLR